MLPTWILRFKAAVPLGPILHEIRGLLNLGLAILEQVLALSLGCVLISFAIGAVWDGWYLTLKRMGKVEFSWLALIVFLTPFYFRTIREFLEQAQEGPLGFKKTKKLEAQDKGNLPNLPGPDVGGNE